MSVSGAIPYGNSSYAQTALGLQGRSDLITKHFNPVYRFNAFNERAAPSIRSTYELGSEGTYLDNGTFGIYRMYAYDHVNGRTVWFIDSNNPTTFIYPAPIDVFVENNLSVRGGVNAGALYYSQLCKASTAPATCGGAPSGSAVIPAGMTSLIVNTTAVTQQSVILLTVDASLGATLGTTCGTTAANVAVIPRSPGQGFTVTLSNGSALNGRVCFSYAIHN